MSLIVLYKKGYGNRLHEKFELYIPDIFTDKIIAGSDNYIILHPDGLMKFKRGYSWDGASGPTVDTKNTIRGSLVHDGLYQLMRENKLKRLHRNYVDRLLRRHLREDGMNWFRAWYWYKGVYIGAKKASLERSQRKVLSAP